MALLDVIMGPEIFIIPILVYALPVVLLVTGIMLFVRWKKGKNDQDKKEKE